MRVRHLSNCDLQSESFHRYIGLLHSLPDLEERTLCEIHYKDLGHLASDDRVTPIAFLKRSPLKIFITHSISKK